MVTAILILLAVFAVLALVGGIMMMGQSDGCFFSWYMGFNAAKAGCEILAKVFPAILEAIFSNDS